MRQGPYNLGDYESGEITATAAAQDYDQPAPAQLLCCDPTGQYLMGGYAGVVGKRSSDFGATWGNVALGIGYIVWANAGSANKFLSGSTASVVWTDDFGDTWASMNGNLTALTTLCAITHILWIGG